MLVSAMAVSVGERIGEQKAARGRHRGCIVVEVDQPLSQRCAQVPGRPMQRCRSVASVHAPTVSCTSGVGALGGPSYERQRSVRHLVRATEGVRRIGDVIDHPQA